MDLAQLARGLCLSRVSFGAGLLLALGAAMAAANTAIAGAYAAKAPQA